MTETQNPLIARHPSYENLFIAGGGSYNRAKDLPTLGENIVRLVRGEYIDPRYNWDAITETIHQDQPGLLAGISFQELEEQALQNPEVKNWDSHRQLQEGLKYFIEI